MEEPNAYYFGSTGSAKGCWVTLLGLLALIFICTTNRGNNKQCQTKQNQGISEYAFGSTRFPNRSRKQTSNSIHVQAALKTRSQISEMLAHFLGTGLFNPILMVQQLRVFLIFLKKKKS